MAVSTRVEVIDEAEPDIVLSVRCHNGDSPNFTTMLVFANPPASKYHEDSEALARTITEVYTDAGYAPQCGYYYYHPIKTGYYQEHLVPIDDKTDYEEESWDLMNAKAPVVIVSQINVNNEEEAAAWGTEEGWKKAADLYYRALVNCYKAD
jgi:N-acetylmuramoyl-L-alanine amidase